MNELFDEALDLMEETFSILEGMVPKPQRVPVSDGYWHRYSEQTPEQAIVQKLARYVSGLHAACLLNGHGFVQEQAALQRMLDEFGEDIYFLSLGVKTGLTQRHRDYLTYFYAEEFVDPDAPLQPGATRRPTVPRQKVRAYLVSHVTGEGINPALVSSAFGTVSGAYSGFVHGASPQIMDMYGGDPPRFHLSGMLGTPRVEGAELDLWNYVFRGLLAFAFAAAAFGSDELFESLRERIAAFQATSASFFPPA